MTTQIILWGAKGHALVIRDLLGVLPRDYQITAVFDNDPTATSPIPGVPIYIGLPGYSKWRAAQEDPHHAAIAIGTDGRARHTIQQMLTRDGLICPLLVHPESYVALDAILCQGCQILAGAVVAAGAALGESCIVNTCASVDHESRLGHGVHIAAGARLCGCVTVGDYTFIGAGAVVLPRITIGPHCIIGAGATVYHDVAPRTVLNPVRTAAQYPVLEEEDSIQTPNPLTV